MSQAKPKRTYNRVDADGHVLEPLDLWDLYVDPKYKGRTPKLDVQPNGEEFVNIDGLVVKADVRNAGSAYARSGGDAKMVNGYVKGVKGGFDPHSRIPDMEKDRIDAAVLYPTVGLMTGALKDGDLSAALCRAYNRWLVDYCSPYPDRLFGVAMLPMQTVDLAIDELRYARTQLGMRAAFIRPNPYNNRMLSDPEYDRLWAVAQELDVSIGLHEGTGGMSALGGDRIGGLGWHGKHIMSHTMEMMQASLHLIFGGVCERFPKLRFAFLESSGGWIGPWLDRMDRHFDDKFRNIPLKMRPSEYFRRQCWISFEPVELCLPLLVPYLGAERIMWATDYPHKDAFYPGAPDMIEKHLREHNLSESVQHQVLAQGAIDFYRLD